MESPDIVHKDKDKVLSRARLNPIPVNCEKVSQLFHSFLGFLCFHSTQYISRTRAQNIHTYNNPFNNLEQSHISHHSQFDLQFYVMSVLVECWF